MAGGLTMSKSNAATMDDLMARVGYLFLNWGFLENRIRSQKGSLSSLQTIPGAQEARRIRNLIAHGIISASIPIDGASPHVCCRPQDDANEERVTYEQLGAAIETLERALFDLKL